MILLDTNVLLYSVNRATPQHADARALLGFCAAGSVPGVVVPQVLLEFYAIATSSRRIARPLTPQQARTEIDGFCRRLAVRSVPVNSFDALLTLLDSRPVTGHQVFDHLLVAQMRSLGIGDICTYNAADFALPGIRALEPLQVLALYPVS